MPRALLDTMTLPPGSLDCTTNFSPPTVMSPCRNRARSDDENRDRHVDTPCNPLTVVFILVCIHSAQFPALLARGLFFSQRSPGRARFSGVFPSRSPGTCIGFGAGEGAPFLLPYRSSIYFKSWPTELRLPFSFGVKGRLTETRTYNTSQKEGLAVEVLDYTQRPTEWTLKSSLREPGTNSNERDSAKCCSKAVVSHPASQIQ